LTRSPGAGADRRVTSRAGYWIGGALIVAAVAGAVLWGVLSFIGLGETIDDFARVQAPGAQTVRSSRRASTSSTSKARAPARTACRPSRLRSSTPAPIAPCPSTRYGGSVTYSFGCGSSGGTVGHPPGMTPRA